MKATPPRFFILILSILFCLPGLIRANDSAIPDATRQLLIVTGKDWDSSSARVFLCEKRGNQWEKISPVYDAVVGKKGMALPDDDQTFRVSSKSSGPTKVEGDMRAPAGIFKLGPILGYADRLPFETAWKYQQITETLQGVDDPHSKYYNQLIDTQGRSLADIDWKSHETMKRKDWLYKWLAVILSNEKNIPGKGSMDFLHVWRAKGKGTAGCTALAEGDLLKILRWLDPTKEPLMVQAPLEVYVDFRKRENLPNINEKE